MVATLCLFLFNAAQAQSAAPHMEAAWKTPTVLLVTWRGAPKGSCAYLNGTLLPYGCGATRSMLVPAFGVDGAYRPDPGDVLTLSLDTTDAPLARTVVPAHVVILPLVAE